MSRIVTFILVAIGLLMVPVKSRCQTFDYVENSVYVYNFIKYTSWPQKKPIIHIGIIGNSPLEEALKGLLSRKKKQYHEFCS